MVANREQMDEGLKQVRQITGMVGKIWRNKGGEQCGEKKSSFWTPYQLGIGMSSS